MGNQMKPTAIAKVARIALWLGVLIDAVLAQGTHDPTPINSGLLKFEMMGTKTNEASTAACIRILRERLDPDNKGTIKLSSPAPRMIWVEVLDRDGAADLRYLARVRSICEAQGFLEFRILADTEHDDAKIIDHHTKRLRTDGPERRLGDQMGWFKIENPARFFNLNSPEELKQFKPESLLSIVARRRGESFYVLARAGRESAVSRSIDTKVTWTIKSAEAERDPMGNPCLKIKLDTAGGKLMGRLTRENKMRTLCVLLDELALSQMRIMDEISSNAAIYGQFRPHDVEDLARILRTEPMPVSLRLIEARP